MSLEALPLPPPGDMKKIERLMKKRVTRETLERAVERLYINGDRMMPLPPLSSVPDIHERLQDEFSPMERRIETT